MFWRLCISAQPGVNKILTMRYGSVCSGIEAATTKACAKCNQFKPLDQFHSQPGGKYGRHSYCKPCANALQKLSRQKNGRPPRKRKWQIKSRYGLTVEMVDAMREEQKGVCAICAKAMKRECIDHCHITGRVRGLLCQRCNLLIRGLDDPEYRQAILNYLDKPKCVI